MKPLKIKGYEIFFTVRRYGVSYIRLRHNKGGYWVFYGIELLGVTYGVLILDLRK